MEFKHLHKCWNILFHFQQHQFPLQHAHVLLIEGLLGHWQQQHPIIDGDYVVEQLDELKDLREVVLTDEILHPDMRTTGFGDASRKFLISE